MADQQFCLRWNNHQSTLISVFDSLQERGCMVDCTLAAEGQSLQAHKVVLSACSPYLEDLLSKHYDKHPILLLKDVKFEELKAMMDYMYRGEVNVAQDKLGTFLRAAESLQIKGLTDNGGEPPDTGGGPSTAAKRTNKGTPVQAVRSNAGLTVRPAVVDENSREDGSVSPSRRKRRRRVSEETQVNDSASNAPESKPTPAVAAPSSTVTVPNELLPPIVPAENYGMISMMDNETDPALDSALSSATVPHLPRENNVINEKLEEPTPELLIEPKTEYVDDDDVQDLTQDDDEMYAPGPSHSGASGQFMQANDTTDEVFMAAQEAVGANKETQG